MGKEGGKNMNIGMRFEFGTYLEVMKYVITLENAKSIHIFKKESWVVTFESAPILYTCNDCEDVYDKKDMHIHNEKTMRGVCTHCVEDRRIVYEELPDHPEDCKCSQCSPHFWRQY